MSATPEQIAELCERLRSHAANAPVISRQSIDMDAAAAVILAQAEEIARLEGAAGEVWDEAYAEGAGDTAGWEKETSHAVLKWLDKEGDGFDIHHPDGNTTDAIIQGLYDAKRIGNLAELRTQSEREKVLALALRRLTYWAQTSGGTAGRDDGLVAAIDIAVEALRAHDAALAGAR